MARKSVKKNSRKIDSPKRPLLKKSVKSYPVELVTTNKQKSKQAELEIQNEELRTSQQKLEESQIKYADLYDFAPIGYFTFDKHGTILEVNLTGAQLLGIPRSSLLKKPFSLHLSSNNKSIFFSHLKDVFRTGRRQTCELKLMKKGLQFYARLESIAVPDSAGNNSFCRIAISDITELKRAEDERKHFASFPKLNPNPVLELDSSGKIIFCNDATYQILDKLKLKDANVFLPDDITDILSSIKQKGDVLYYREVRIKDQIFGEYLHFEPQFNSIRIYANDITERKKAEIEKQLLLNEIQAERDKLSALVNSISDEVWLADANKKFTLMNPSALREFGLVSNKVDVEKLAASLEVYRPDGSPRPIEEAPPLRALKGEEVKNLEEIIRIPTSGELRTRQVNASPVRDSRGNIIGSVAVVRDITERKKAEEVLRIERQKLTNILDSMVDGMYIINQQNEIEYINPSMEKEYGPVNGRKCHEYFEDKKEVCPWCKNEEVFKGKTLRWEWYSTKTKKTYDLINTSLRNPDGSVSKLGIFRDITSRKRAEEALRESENRFRAVFESSSDCILVWDRQYNYLYANQAAIDHVGTTRNKVIGKNIREGLGHVPDFMQLWMGRVERAFATGKPFRVEDAVPVGDRLVHTESQVSPIRDATGQVFAVGVVYRDVTERKKMEELLRKSHDELEIRVQERTAELSKAYKEFEAFFDSSLTPLVFLDREFNFIKVNQAYAKACQRDISEFFGHNHFEYYPNEENEAIFREVVESKSPYQAFAKPFIFPDHPEWGTTYWDWTLTPILNPNGGVDFLVFALNDVTKRKQAEIAVKESEKKYKLLIEQASDGIVVLDQELNVLEANSMVSEITGYSREELLSMNTTEIMPPDELTSIAPSLQRVLSGETVIEECKLKHKNGSHVFIDISVKMLENRLIQVIFRNITQKKEIENRMHTTKRLLELFAKTSSRREYLDSVVDLFHEWTGCRCIGIRVLDKDGNIPYESYRGFSQDFWEHENWISIKDQCACARVVLQKPDPKDTSMITPKGSFICNNTAEFARGLTEKDISRYRGLCIRMGFKSIAIVPIHYKETVLGAFHFADKHEGMVPTEKIEFIESISPLVGEAILRFSAEEELLKSEARLSEAQSIAHLGNWEWNIQTNQLHWSYEIYRIFGLSPQQLDTTYEAFLDSVHPKDRESVKKAVNEALYEKKPYRIDHRIVLPDGTVRIVSEQAAVSFDDAGKPIRMHGIVRDITEHKRAEEELKKSYEQLRNLSQHLHSVREEERTHIAREIHDELGQALTALKMDLSMITNKLYPDHKLLVEKTESIIKRIDETIQTVKKICTELRPTVLDHFGLSAAIEWQAEDFQKRTGINCKVSFHPEDIVLDKDTSIVIFRIFQEALTNVMRHADATEVETILTIKDGMITLEVEDNGKGITEEKVTNSGSFGLLGIRERVNFLGGNVKISGTRNEGTTIKVNIPFIKKGEFINEDTHR